ncbi:MAG: TlpA family protein disulfide reductase [Candidatus Dormibacteria bacterium]
MLPKRRPGPAGIFLSAALTVLAGCGAAQAPASNVAPPQVQGQAQGGQLKIGQEAPDFTATAFDGSQVRLSSLRGKVVLVNFFASWCTECRAEFPDIQAAYAARNKDGFEVIGVNALETSDGKAFYREMKATYPAVSDPAPGGGGPGPIAAAYGVVSGLPVSAFIDRDGKLHDLLQGRIDSTNIRDELKALGIS